MKILAWYPGMILGAFFWKLVAIAGLLAVGGIFGWMLAKGVNPIRWFWDRFNPRDEN